MPDENMSNKNSNILSINNLFVSVEGNKILDGVSLNLEKGKTHVLMGPNGSGKSTLAQVLMGHPDYEITKGEIKFENLDLLKLNTDERAKKGIFLSFQYPSEVTGVNVSNYLRMIYNISQNEKREEKLSPVKFRKHIWQKLELLKIDESFLNRYLNEGFSGGEKKRMEILQMLLLEPKLAILDETDSGLDIDAIKIVSEAVNQLKTKTELTVLIITHYTRILRYISSDKVFVMQRGKITKSGDNSLAQELEEKGYAPFGD